MVDVSWDENSLSKSFCEAAMRKIMQEGVPGLGVLGVFLFLFFQLCHEKICKWGKLFYLGGHLFIK